MTTHTTDIVCTDYGIILDGRAVLSHGQQLPKLSGDWQVVSLFADIAGHNIFVLRDGAQRAFWLLDESFKLLSDNVKSIYDLALAEASRQHRNPFETTILEEILCILRTALGEFESAFSHFSDMVPESDVGHMPRDIETYLALAESAIALGGLTKMIPPLQSLLVAADGIRYQQRACVEAWIGRAFADAGDFANGTKYIASSIARSRKLPYWVPDYMAFASNHDYSKTAGDMPDLMWEEVERFGKTISRFFNEGEADWTPGRYPSVALARQWMRRNVRHVFIEKENPEGVNLLRSGGISSVFLDAAMQDIDGVGDKCYSMSSDVPFSADSTISLRLKDVASTVVLGGKPILCPFTGNREIVRDTIDLHTFLYRKNGRSCIILSGRDISLPSGDQAWFFPDLGIIASNGHNRRPHYDLGVTLGRLVNNLEAIKRYLVTPERKVMISEYWMGHIGHYIWNVISGWSGLFRLTEGADIGIITSYNVGQFFGGVLELYGDMIPENTMTHSIRLEDEAVSIMLENNSIALLLRDRTVTDDLAKRVNAWCEHHAADSFRKELRALRERCKPLIMITLRVEDRAWVDQAQGYSHTLNCLREDFPDLGVVIDGINAPSPPGTKVHSTQTLNDEKKIAASIIAACPSVRFYDAIGCSHAESILLCGAIDAFMAPVGAGLAKSRWIANKPGVAFSNSRFLAEGNFDGHLYSHFRENAVPMYYVPRSDVSDSDSGPPGEPGRANFTMKWESLYHEFAVLLTNLQ